MNSYTGIVTSLEFEPHLGLWFVNLRNAKYPTDFGQQGRMRSFCEYPKPSLHLFKGYERGLKPPDLTAFGTKGVVVGLRVRVFYDPPDAEYSVSRVEPLAD